MEAHRHTRGLGSLRLKPGLSSRNNAVIIAIISAAAAGLLIYLFVSHYRGKTTTVQLPPTEMTVFKARGYIPAGTPEALVASEHLLQPVQVPLSQAIAGAISDPAEVADEVVAAPIAAGQQVTVADFSHTNETIASYLKGDERDIAFAIDPPHGLTSYIAPGNTLDVIAEFRGGAAKAELIAQNVTVVSNAAGDVVLRLSDKQALQMIADQHVATLWFVLRAVRGATNSIKVGTVEGF